MTNFTNGALVFRVWPDGSGEIMAKFQYMGDAESYASFKCVDDAKVRNDCTHFYLAVCESENKMKAYRPSLVVSPQRKDGAAQ